MKLRLKQIPVLYFNSWWIPSAVFVVLLIAFTVTALSRWRWLAIVSNMLFVCLAIAFLGILCTGIWNLIKKRWGKGFISLVMFPACGVVAFIAMNFLMFASMFGPSEDGFADNLMIPADVEVADPLSEVDAAPFGICKSPCYRGYCTTAVRRVFRRQGYCFLIRFNRFFKVCKIVQVANSGLQDRQDCSNVLAGLVRYFTQMLIPGSEVKSSQFGKLRCNDRNI